MRKTINIPEEKFRKALKSILEMDLKVPSEQDSPNDPFNSQRNKIPNPNNRTLDNHEEGTVGTNIDQTEYDPNGRMSIENP